jgi:hypothetical protein
LRTATVSDAISLSTHVFLAKTVRRELAIPDEYFPTCDYEFETQAVWKGAPHQKFKARSGCGGGCGIDYHPGLSYLIYAGVDKDNSELVQLYGCGRDTQYSWALADLIALGKPIWTNGEEVIPMSTSGLSLSLEVHRDAGTIIPSTFSLHLHNVTTHTVHLSSAQDFISMFDFMILEGENLYTAVRILRISTGYDEQEIAIRAGERFKIRFDRGAIGEEYPIAPLRAWFRNPGTFQIYLALSPEGKPSITGHPIVFTKPIEITVPKP